MWNDSLPRRSEGENPAQPHFSTVRWVRKKLQVCSQFQWAKESDGASWLSGSQQISKFQVTPHSNTERNGTERDARCLFASREYQYAIGCRAKDTANKQEITNNWQKSQKNMRGCIRINNIYILCYMYYIILIYFITWYYITLYYIVLYYIIILYYIILL